MKEIRYGNRRMNDGKYRPLVVDEKVAADIVNRCLTQTAALAANLIIVDVSCWDDALDLARAAQRQGHDIFRLALKF